MSASSNSETRALYRVRPGADLDRFHNDLAKIRELYRCEIEQDEILNREAVINTLCECGESPCVCPGVKAWLVVLGLEDWECEKRLIEAGA